MALLRELQPEDFSEGNYLNCKSSWQIPLLETTLLETENRGNHLSRATEVASPWGIQVPVVLGLRVLELRGERPHRVLQPVPSPALLARCQAPPAAAERAASLAWSHQSLPEPSRGGASVCPSIPGRPSGPQQEGDASTAPSGARTDLPVQAQRAAPCSLHGGD